MQVRGLIGASGRRPALALAASAVALCSIGAQASAAGATTAQRARPSAPLASAVLEECLTSPVQAERSATFAGEMTAVAGTVRMAMRIDVDERMPEETTYHTVTAPGRCAGQFASSTAATPARHSVSDRFYLELLRQ